MKIVRLGTMLLFAVTAVGACGKGKDKDAPAAAPATTPAAQAQPEKAPPPAPVASKCPAATSVTALVSAKDISAAGPFDLAGFTYARAAWSADHSKIDVFVANKDWSVAQFRSLPSPIASNGEAYLSLSFALGGEPAVGVYPASMHDPEVNRFVSTSLFVHDESLGISLGESKAEIVALADGTLCGTFDLNGDMELDGATTHFAGTFVAELEDK